MYIGPPPALPNSSSKELFILQNQELCNITQTLYSQLDGSGAQHMTSKQALQALQDTEEQVKAKEQGKVQRAEDHKKKKQAKQVQDEEKAAQKRATVEKRQQTAEQRKEEAQQKALDSTIEKAFCGLVAVEKALIKASRPVWHCWRLAEGDDEDYEAIVLPASGSNDDSSPDAPVRPPPTLAPPSTHPCPLPHRLQCPAAALASAPVTSAHIELPAPSSPTPPPRGVTPSPAQPRPHACHFHEPSVTTSLNEAETEDSAAAFNSRMAGGSGDGLGGSNSGPHALNNSSGASGPSSSSSDPPLLFPAPLVVSPAHTLLNLVDGPFFATLFHLL
ncbi:hypothetical protein BDN71DRAFT_1449189 [Pleurotus eryngii]|uniref:Uncharacterized protein n=1 Tax=Pleurotus eryngii TaxID=5323 RepID=A0A9P5ZU14_PLEER|nr:hypothetical protein BDN71DRAFT_1449189 [Pleurotus eryngii]